MRLPERAIREWNLWRIYRTHIRPSFDSAARLAIKHQIKSLGLQVSNINAFTLFAEGDTYHPTWIEDERAAARVANRAHEGLHRAGERNGVRHDQHSAGRADDRDGTEDRATARKPVCRWLGAACFHWLSGRMSP